MGLKTAQLTFFDTMLFANDRMQLAAITTSSTYPLGELLIKSDFDAQEQVVAERATWLNETVMYSLDLQVGDEVELGAATFTVSHILSEEPDAPFNIFSGSRRVLLNEADIAKTEVIQPGSRVFYRQLYAGDGDDVEAFYQGLKPQLAENQRWYGVKDRQSPIANSLERSERFLLGRSVGHYSRGSGYCGISKTLLRAPIRPVAMMKTLGRARAQIRAIYLLHLSLVCGFSLLIGLAVGYSLQHVAADYMAKSMDISLPPASLRPWLSAVFIGVVCAVMFSIKPLLDLFDIPPLRVLRRNLGDRLVVSKIHLALSALTVFGLMWLFSGKIKITLILFASSALVVVVLFVASKVIFGTGRKLGLSPGNSWSLALASFKAG